MTLLTETDSEKSREWSKEIYSELTKGKSDMPSPGWTYVTVTI